MDHHFPRLGRDHELATQLEEKLLKIGFNVAKKVETNMVWVDLSPWKDLDAEKLSTFLAARGIRCFGGHGSKQVRFVVHAQIPKEGISMLVQAFEELLLTVQRSEYK